MNTETYSWADVRGCYAEVGRAVKRHMIRLWGWVQWMAWGRLHARLALDAFETVAKRRARGTAT
jgi:hypothetical protein